MRPALCIIVPVLDEAATLAPRLRALEPLRRRGADLHNCQALIVLLMGYKVTHWPAAILQTPTATGCNVGEFR